METSEATAIATLTGQEQMQAARAMMDARDLVESAATALSAIEGDVMRGASTLDGAALENIALVLSDAARKCRAAAAAA